MFFFSILNNEIIPVRIIAEKKMIPKDISIVYSFLFSQKNLIECSTVNITTQKTSILKKE